MPFERLAGILVYGVGVLTFRVIRRSVCGHAPTIEVNVHPMLQCCEAVSQGGCPCLKLVQSSIPQIDPIRSDS